MQSAVIKKNESLKKFTAMEDFQNMLNKKNPMIENIIPFLWKRDAYYVCYM